jgi:hypothetical protein
MITSSIWRRIVLTALAAVALGPVGATTPTNPQATSTSAASTANQTASQPASGQATILVPAGKVELSEGKVQVYTDPAKPRSVKAGDTINEGDNIVTGTDGELHVNMEDGGFIAVRPNTTMRVVQYRAQGDKKDTGVFSLLQGSFRSITGWIGKYNSRSYRIQTPTATIGIRGTDHEPLVIPDGSSEGEAGTYDKVNAGGSYIETPHGKVDVQPGRAAFAPAARLKGKQAPRLLADVPHFFRASRHENLLEHRHDAIRQKLGNLRDDRRKSILEQRKALRNPAADRSQRFQGKAERQEKQRALRAARNKQRADKKPLGERKFQRNRALQDRSTDNQDAPSPRFKERPRRFRG